MSEAADMGDADLHNKSDSSASDPLEIVNEDDWEDVEPANEKVSFVSLFDDSVFDDVNELLTYDQKNYHFDFRRSRRELELDFEASVKLINYVRSEVKAARRNIDVSSRTLFEDDRYMKPVLEDDALLYNLDDIVDNQDPSVNGGHCRQQELLVQELREELIRLQSRFSAYKEEVQKALQAQLDSDDPASVPSSSEARAKEVKGETVAKGVATDLEAGYFSSYSYNEIHESMLKDKVRTDAYRDFIYENKSIFKDKLVLDVGCGTGILSMFCAQAGARMVVAVDNSDIIDKARQNVYDNGFQDTITCLRGKIEEVNMPIPKVDVIVSEWMGYCLLYESMLDSVIWARDIYLKPDGLMVPSHAVVRIAPLGDSELVESHLDFWKEVYGFNMTSMLERAHDEALIRSINPQDLAADGVPFLELDLHTAKVTELTFMHDFHLVLNKTVVRLDGFVIWFDMYFLSQRNETPDYSMTTTKAKERGIVSFSTGPDATQTHWCQGALLLTEPVGMAAGDSVMGNIGYQKMEGQERSLEIEVRWETRHLPGRRTQVWQLN